MAQRKRYKIQCITEGGIFVDGYTNADEAPDLCPNNPAHTVNDSSTTVVEILALDNLEATTDPTVTDDIDDGYLSGVSHWFNNVSGDEFLCADNTVGAAVWRKVTPDFGTGESYGVSLAEATTTSSDYQQKLRVTTPDLVAGNYIILWSCHGKSSAIAKASSYRVQLDDTTDLSVWSVNVIGYSGFSGFSKNALGAGSHTIDFDFHADANSTAYIQEARIVLWRVS